jgi:hypothetical protein
LFGEIMAKRRHNERDYHGWTDLPDGGRRYWKDRRGVQSGFQRMVKVVDANEITLLVVQEVYNDDNELIETHQKFPIDSEHKYVGGKE